MDPNAALDRYWYAVQSGDRREAREAKADLLEWLRGGGFEPDWTVDGHSREEFYGRARRRAPSRVAASKSKPKRREQSFGSFIVELWSGQTARFHDMPRAQAWALERLSGQAAGAYAAFYRAPVGPDRHDTGAPWTEPFHVLVINEYGRINVADRDNWPNIPQRAEMFPYRGNDGASGGSVSESSEPSGDWKEVGHIGDVNWPEYGGGPVLVDSTGEAVLEYVEPPSDDEFNDPAARWTVYRVTLDPEVPSWGDIKEVARSAGATSKELRAGFTSDNPMARAFAYETWAGHYGWHEFDNYPLTLTCAEMNERYSADLDCGGDEDLEESQPRKRR